MRRGLGTLGWLHEELRWLLVLALGLSVILRWVVATSPSLGRLNSDQAVLYLTARQAAHGHLVAWFWGQEYGGSLVQTLLGLVFALVGAHLWLLPVALAATSTAVAVLTWRVGVAMGFPAQGAVAGALLAVGPPEWLYLGVSSDGFYSAGLVGSLVALLIAVSPAEITHRRAAAAGLAVGVALWESPFSLLTALPALVLLARRLARRPAPSATAFAGLLIGALPQLVTTLHRGKLMPTSPVPHDGVARRVENAVTHTWTAVFTRFDPDQVPDWLVDRLAVVALLAAIALGVIALSRTVERHADWLTAGLLLPAVLWIPFHVRADLPSDDPASRYGVPLLPFIALFAVRYLRTSRAMVWSVLGFALFSATGIAQASRAPSPGQGVLHNSNYRDLERDLLSHGRTAVFADYWIAYRLTAESDERVVADPPAMSRHRAYAKAADAAPLTTAVVFSGEVNDKAFRTAFANDSGVERVQVDQFAIYYFERRQVLPGFAPTANIP